MGQTCCNYIKQEGALDFNKGKNAPTKKEKEEMAELLKHAEEN